MDTQEEFDKAFKAVRDGIQEVRNDLDALINEIEEEGSYLNEHGCTAIVEILKKIRKKLD